MSAKAEVTLNYGKCSPEERAKLIYLNYATFEGIINCFQEDLINDIESEQQYIQRQNLGDLGVRVQGSGAYSNPTWDKASSLVLLEKMVNDESMSEEDLASLLDCDELIYRHRVLCLMKKDFRRFNLQLSKLQPEDRQIIIPFLNREKDYEQISNELSITVESARVRVYRIRKSMLTELAQKLLDMKGRIEP
ncbi:sigma-70 family RNA polymerase sigma factor [Butyrivibrio sp. INlla14]|uniref:sigma-70 family RNA polymerase sigma factor n=1 Tax=Butyrivibrio sp. INlla14 TaxID=1520808 RepID=UPI0008761FF2|nr:sigma-70 family RNA polymerase sigma factor [Butyrivibrio sp. INlla14]SCY62757.1 hypothetical protein SAMN02910371_03088 [Butyrivibrio sp. INlla14]